MTEHQQPAPQFLTLEEAAEVDKALMSSREKFSTRLAIYALRSLKEIAGNTGGALEEVTPAQVRAWIENDQSVKRDRDIDTGFESFFTQLVLSSLKPLKQIAQETSAPIETLTVQQVVAWFEKDAKHRREREAGATP
ncbi:MAG: hypothetical protein MUC60_01940 [Oscillatoria sp. Prado101]|jgi:hypothetical protein|nr:hypothetical protein [Oscillatoria sp. Prado101]